MSPNDDDNDDKENNGDFRLNLKSQGVFIFSVIACFMINIFVNVF